MMKKIFVFAICCMMSSLAMAAPYRRMYGNNYKKNDNWYLGAHADLTFLNWKNTYKENGEVKGNDKFSFKPVFGADISVGYRMNKKYRFDLEFGYVGEYTETETEHLSDYITEKTTFGLDALYLSANAYYGIYNGLYAGVGIGGALVGVSEEHTHANEVSEHSLSPMGSVMLGYAYKLDKNLDLDVRYRFSAIDGPTVKMFNLDTEIGWMLNHTVSVGVIYNF